ncbi:adenylyltransferase/cytidyltransferase family protein [Thiomicrorhabdus indica]|uniref:adenylyltransferase/cytidyltransferase family protein n=1 Tax=Thiomicrorhabdus indica TaxID=2267253 RepID=UPI002AA95A1E|nr:adenylyltransferase/cytidyltransferase family protein [Thiomicrorhabdus indica]
MITNNQIIHKALKAFHAKDYALAEKLFQELKARSPDLVIVPIYLAQLDLLKFRGSHWIKTLENLLEQKPYLVEAYFVLAQCYQQAKQLPKAAQTYHQALAYLMQKKDFDCSTDHSEKSDSLAKWDLKVATETLWQTLQILAQKNIPAFPTSGTLLGLERDGKLLENDKDIDIGLDWLLMEQAIAELEHYGYREVQASYGLMNPRCLQSPSGMIVDLCGYATEENTGQTVSGLWVKDVPFELNRVTYYPKIDLETKNSPAGQVWGLKNAKAFLTALYGDDWQTPDSDFDTIVCAKNLKGFAPLTQCYAYSRLYKHLSQNRLGKAKRLTQEILKHHPEDGLTQHLWNQLSSAIHRQTATKVLAMGCFDLLHIGHLNYFNFAKQQGNYLMVGLASDKFCQDSKGHRPTIDQTQRQALVQSFKMVDETHILPVPMADTPQASEWIEQLGIQKVVCGQAWQPSEKWQRLQIALAEKGIEVIYAPHTDGVSSTLIKQQVTQRSLS